MFKSHQTERVTSDHLLQWNGTPEVCNEGMRGLSHRNGSRATSYPNVPERILWRDHGIHVCDNNTGYAGIQTLQRSKEVDRIALGDETQGSQSRKEAGSTTHGTSGCTHLPTLINVACEARTHPLDLGQQIWRPSTHADRGGDRSPRWINTNPDQHAWVEGGPGREQEGLEGNLHPISMEGCIQRRDEETRHLEGGREKAASRDPRGPYTEKNQSTNRRQTNIHVHHEKSHQQCSEVTREDPGRLRPRTVPGSRDDRPLNESGGDPYPSPTIPTHPNSSLDTAWSADKTGIGCPHFIHSNSTLWGGARKTPNGHVTLPTPSPGEHLSSECPPNCPANVPASIFHVTGYSVDQDNHKSPLDNNVLERARQELNSIIEGVDLDCVLSKDDLLAAVGLSAGLSSESPKLCVFVDGKWIRMKSSNKTKVPLDKIGKHTLDMNKVIKAASTLDPPLKKMLEVFCSYTASLSTRPNLSGIDRKISKNFSRRDLKMLQNAKILSRKKGNFSLLGFKVKKKDPRLSRFITDCRPFNERFKEFSEETMNLPRQHEIMEWGVQHPIIWSVDAKAYFYQFGLKGAASKWFPMSFKLNEEELDFTMNRLPMGCKIAPIIAQRVSNLIIERTRWHMEKEGIEGRVAAWVDNFLMFAHDAATADKIFVILQGQLRYFNILCSPLDTSGAFLGLEKTPSGLRLSLKFRTALRESIRKVLQGDSLTKKQAEILCGRLMWLNYSIKRSPLACFPRTLQLMRDLPKMPHETSITISNHLKEEIERWESDIDLQFTGTPIIKNVPDVWTDATPTRIAVVIGRTVLMAELFRVVDIALAEALAAAWGLIFSNNIAHIHIDNLGIAHALAKGHSSSQTINQVFANIFKKPTHGSVTWVPTEDQVADGPTRNALPKFAASSSERWKIISSMVFAQTKHSPGTG